MANVIKVLPINLINQIAAGEVIERPAAIIKELVENAIDACATEIIIILQNGGKSFISIQDNGIGISKDDLKVCLLPHTTSKLPTENLFEINTLGFRGEALASIASISKISISSKHYEEENAYEISAANGVIEDIKPSNAQQGTLIKVRDLFFSIPARLKFLRNDSTEASNCFGVIKRLALSNPRISFKVEHNSKKVLSYDAIKGTDEEVLKYRVAQVVNSDFINNSIYVDENNPVMRIHGFLGLPTYSQANSSNQFIMLNQRSLKDKNLAYLVKLGYGDNLVSGRQPCYVLFIEIDNSEVDINVNPTKSEVRFKDTNLVKHIFLEIIKNKILAKPSQDNNSNIAKTLLSKAHEKTVKPPKQPYLSLNDRVQNGKSRDRLNTYLEAMVNESLNKPSSFNDCLTLQESSGTQFNHVEDVSRVKENYKEHLDSNNLLDTSSDLGANIEPKTEIKVTTMEDFSSSQVEISQSKIDGAYDRGVAGSVIEEAPLGFAKGQLHKNWIVAQNKEGLVIVDQHAAHERITHESLKEQYSKQRIARQMLLIPELLELDPQELSILESYQDKITALGIVFDFFGNNVVLVKELPAILGQANVKVLMQELIGDLLTLESSESFDKKINAILAKIACHGSIRSGKELTIAEMNDLLRTMEKTKGYAQCSHGRPTFIKISLKHLESLFGR